MGEVYDFEAHRSERLEDDLNRKERMRSHPMFQARLIQAEQEIARSYDIGRSFSEADDWLIDMFCPLNTSLELPVETSAKLSESLLHAHEKLYSSVRLQDKYKESTKQREQWYDIFEVDHDQHEAIFDIIQLSYAQTMGTLTLRQVCTDRAPASDQPSSQDWNACGLWRARCKDILLDISKNDPDLSMAAIRVDQAFDMSKRTEKHVQHYIADILPLRYATHHSRRLAKQYIKTKAPSLRTLVDTAEASGRPLQITHQLQDMAIDSVRKHLRHGAAYDDVVEQLAIATPMSHVEVSQFERTYLLAQ